MDAKGNHLSTYDVLLGDSYIYLLLNQDILLQVLMTKASLLNHLRRAPMSISLRDTRARLVVS